MCACEKKFDVIACGQVTSDDLYFAGGGESLRTPGGCCIWSCIGAAFWSERIAALSRCGCSLAYPAQAFAAFGIDGSGVRRYADKPGIHDRIVYDEAGNKVCRGLVQPSSTPFEMTPAFGDMPYAYYDDARGFMMNGGLLERCGDFFEKLPRRLILGLDPAVIPGQHGRLAQWRAVFSAVDCLLPSELELTILLDIPVQRDAGAYLPHIRALCAGRTRVFCLKLGERGALLYDVRRDAAWLLPSAARRIVDTTGCGDAFCGGFLTGYVQTGDACTACAMGAVSAAKVIEHTGSGFFEATDKKEMRERLAAYRSAVDLDKCRLA